MGSVIIHAEKWVVQKLGFPKFMETTHLPEDGRNGFDAGGRGSQPPPGGTVVVSGVVCCSGGLQGFMVFAWV